MPYMDGTITDQHFVKRDRLGRSIGFLARIRAGWHGDLCA